MNNNYSLRKVVVFLLLGVALVAIPLTVYLAQRQQSTQSDASVVSEDTVVAVINGKQIKKAQVRTVAEESNEPADVNADKLKDALLVIEEREILDNATVQLGIQVNSEWVDELLKEGYSENDAKYQVLKNQVILKAVKSREAITIQFWNTPESGLASLTDKEKDDAKKQLSDGLSALSQAETGLVRGDNVFAVGDSILENYSSLKPVLAVNGFILDGLTDVERTAASHGQIYEFGDSGLDNETKNVLFGLQVDSIKTVSGTPTNRGGIVFKVISANDTGTNTFEAWYAGQKSSLVKNLNKL